MPYIKIDQDILDSSVWPDRNRRSVWFTMMLMARPVVLEESAAALDVDTMQPTGWNAPPGRYGMVYAASVGIAQQDGCTPDMCLEQLRELAGPDLQSRSPEYEGRRIARIAGGYIILNYAKYRDRQESSTEKVRKWREKKKQERETVTGNSNRETVTPTAVTGKETHVDVDVEVDVEKYTPVVPSQEGTQPVSRSRAHTATAHGNGRRPRADRGEAALIVARILKTAQRNHHTNKSFIPRAAVEAMGLHIAMAYDAVGGGDVFISAAGTKEQSFLARNFADALLAARRTFPAEQD